MSESGTERSELASEMLEGLDEGFHYATLAFDEEGNVVGVAWNYEREGGDPWHNDRFTDRELSERRRELAIEHQEQYEDAAETEQAKLPMTDGGEPQETGTERETLGENDPEAYNEAADRFTSEPDRGVWVVEENRGNGWTVDAVLTSHEDARAYIKDKRDFVENCPEGSSETFCRSTIRFRYDGRKSPTKLFESWPPEGGESDDE